MELKRSLSYWIIPFTLKAGSYYFSPDSVKFFGSRLMKWCYKHPGTENDVTFIDSVRTWSGRRYYKVVDMTVDGDGSVCIETVGDTYDHTTAAQAYAAAKRHVRELGASK